MSSVTESSPAAEPALEAVVTAMPPHGEEAFRLLVEAVQDYAIFLLDAGGHVLTWNKGAQRIKGYSADEIIGRHFSVFYRPQDVAAGRPTRVLNAATRYGRTEDEGWRVRKDGTEFWADVVMTALRDDQGRLTGYAKVTRDMTERREAEERERELLVEREARAAAEEALLARDRFLSIAAHELKTPVAALQISAEALLRSQEMGTLSGGRLRTSVARMERAVRRMGALVSQLLDISRLSAGIAFEFGEMDLGSTVREVIDRFTDLPDAERIHADIVPSPMTGDAARLDQVAVNMIDNAIKYSAPPSPVNVCVRPGDGGVLLEVTDHGIGIEPDQVPRLFEAFGRGRNAENVQGMGLGLFIARQIVERHGGRIGYTSPSGGGTSFTVWLPSQPTVDANALD